MNKALSLLLHEGLGSCPREDSKRKMPAFSAVSVHHGASIMLEGRREGVGYELR